MPGTLTSLLPANSISSRPAWLSQSTILSPCPAIIAIGSDSFQGTAQAEALSLARIKAFDNLTLLKMWCEATAATIFPKRKIGFLKDGYDANFLVLTGNPLTDFANVKTIDLRVKQGELLQP